MFPIQSPSPSCDVAASHPVISGATTTIQIAMLMRPGRADRTGQDRKPEIQSLPDFCATWRNELKEADGPGLR